ncbi:hypothetical protein [Cohnella rhizosphaerae]|uniref:Uncharacterized protein n=1 Tax=Cohnella rhizosphaerae TaxID=1457232 RepID=A0A9X4KTL4_9BACL|nr:hypothetical protein [Cohnella rhizosphaerae]MDG0810662.1 hypothetical protein [Cohnella rhizosphaerae]
MLQLEVELQLAAFDFILGNVDLYVLPARPVHAHGRVRVIFGRKRRALAVAELRRQQMTVVAAVYPHADLDRLALNGDAARARRQLQLGRIIDDVDHVVVDSERSAAVPHVLRIALDRRARRYDALRI